MLEKIRNIIKSLESPKKEITKGPVYRVADIIRNEKNQYKITVQIIGKKEFFKIKPEEILADDNLTAAFNPIDIRLLTYLGYCGINTPQYQVLAKKILANEDIQFAIYDSKNDSYQVINISDASTASPDMINKLEPRDAYDLGFAHGRKSILTEKQQLNNE